MVLSSPGSATASITWKALQIGAVLIAAFWIRQASSQTLSADVAAWGESSNGLRIGISSNSVTMPPTGAKFTVAIVGLPAGAIYGLAVSLADYDSPAAQDFQGGLAPGRYQIAARFDGRAATDNNLDSPGIPLMNFWKGRIESRTLTFEIRRQ